MSQAFNAVTLPAEDTAGHLTIVRAGDSVTLTVSRLSFEGVYFQVSVIVERLELRFALQCYRSGVMTSKATGPVPAQHALVQAPMGSMEAMVHSVSISLEANDQGTAGVVVGLKALAASLED